MMADPVPRFGQVAAEGSSSHQWLDRPALSIKRTLMDRWIKLPVALARQVTG